jgi:MFS family permease
MRDRHEDSLNSLAKLRRLPTDDERLQQEWKGILAEVQFQNTLVKQQYGDVGPLRSEFLQWIDLFRPKYLRRTMIAMAIPFFQQFSGINPFVYYAPTFFAALGQSYEMSLILSGMVNICQLVAGIPTFIYLDKMGRRKLAIIGGFAMGIPHMIMAGIFGKFNDKWEANRGVGWLGVALICKLPFLSPEPNSNRAVA